MIRKFKGSLINRNFRFAVVVSRFNEFLSKELLEGCLDSLQRHTDGEPLADVYWVPGVFEIPAAARNAINKGGYDALIALGCLIRGETPHFDLLSQEVTKALSAMSVECGLPVAFGIVTADTIEEAIERTGTKSGNLGSRAADSALEMANLFELMSVPTRAGKKTK